MKNTYTMVKAKVNAIYETQMFWKKMADTFRPFSYKWQECTDMATECQENIDKIFAECNPAYRSMYNLELTRKAR